MRKKGVDTAIASGETKPESCWQLSSGASQNTSGCEVRADWWRSDMWKPPTANGGDSQEERALRNVDALLHALDEDYLRTFRLGGVIQSGGGKEQYTVSASETSPGILDESLPDEDLRDLLPSSRDTGKLSGRPVSTRREVLSEEFQEELDSVPCPPGEEDPRADTRPCEPVAFSNGVSPSETPDAGSFENCLCIPDPPRDWLNTQNPQNISVSEVDEVDKDRRDDIFGILREEESDRKSDFERTWYQGLPSSPSGSESPSSSRSESEEDAEEARVFYQVLTSDVPSPCGDSSGKADMCWDHRFDLSGSEDEEGRTSDCSDTKEDVGAGVSITADTHLRETVTEGYPSVSSSSHVKSSNERCAQNLPGGSRCQLKSGKNKKKGSQGFSSPDNQKSHRAPGHQRNPMDSSQESFRPSSDSRLPNPGNALDPGYGGVEPVENVDSSVAVWNAGNCVVVPASETSVGDEASAEPRGNQAPSEDASAATDDSTRPADMSIDIRMLD
ncbi:hypothetical protein TGP89_216470 [Toxoplasma gondii p89]|uniref:Uncharacterized protein n=1 Tax=Toxoplasma gondii p89 TaxID=943119 RepID=A0A086JHM7_TOXGO|nr:hypothetical protein TGP89_216470 [Toxoplasma gondii p89]